MKIALCGTPQLSVNCLKHFLKNSEYLVTLIITQPDRRSARHKKLEPTPMKQLALENHIDYIQPETNKIEKWQEALNRSQAEAVVVYAYGALIPEKILHLPHYGFINLHPSLLPKYRGAAPVQWAIINGETQIGLTAFCLTKEMDAGDIVIQDQIKTDGDETTAEIFEKIEKEGYFLLERALQIIKKSDFKGQKQDHQQVTYAPKLTKELGEVNWHLNAIEIYNLWRGLQPWPGIYSFVLIKGKRKKITWTQIKTTHQKSEKIGQLKTKDQCVFIGTNSTDIEVVQMCVEGKKQMDSLSFINGFFNELKKQQIVIELKK